MTFITPFPDATDNSEDFSEKRLSTGLISEWCFVQFAH